MLPTDAMTKRCKRVEWNPYVRVSRSRKSGAGQRSADLLASVSITFMNTHDESPSRRFLELRQDALRACLPEFRGRPTEQTSNLPVIRLAMCNSAARLKTARTQPHLAAN